MKKKIQYYISYIYLTVSDEPVFEKNFNPSKIPSNHCSTETILSVVGVFKNVTRSVSLYLRKHNNVIDDLSFSSSSL